MDTEKKQVFISYSRDDYKNKEDNSIRRGNVISEIKKIFDAAHITYWIDEEGVYSGDEYVPVISKAIKMCDVFLFVSSQHSNNSEWTSSEIAAARMYGKKIIPLRLDDSPYNDSIILYIAHLDYLDYRKNPQDALSTLVRSVQSYIRTQEQEQERRNAEIESQKRKKEEEQKRLIAEMELQAEELENDEREAELKRRRLLQTVQNVEDESERNRLTELINSKGSIQRKYAQEIKELKEKNNELMKENSELINSKDSIQRKYAQEIKELEEKNDELMKEETSRKDDKTGYQPSLDDRNLHQNRKWLLLLPLGLVIGFWVGTVVTYTILPSRQLLIQKQDEIQAYEDSLASQEVNTAIMTEKMDSMKELLDSLRIDLEKYKEMEDQANEEMRRKQVMEMTQVEKEWDKERHDLSYLNNKTVWQKSDLQSKKYLEYFERIEKGDWRYLCNESKIRPTNKLWNKILERCDRIHEKGRRENILEVIGHEVHHQHGIDLNRVWSYL